MNKAVEDIIVLGKDSIVQLALELIDEKVEVHNFSKIKVMTDGRTVYVSFMNTIKYLPMNSVFYFDVGVNLIEKVVVYDPVSNGVFESKIKVPFYKQTKQTKKNIQFVMDAINKSDEVGPIDAVNFEDAMTIRENDDYYNIIVVSEFQESSYKIEKISGKIYDSVHAHLAPLPIFGDENKYKFKEIN
ncbi:hypothetical protein QLS71_013400 [Mariniflexile litorale]|uniref:Uncharacterized protein n=1 Tax=Mariniflexile litorale TaxID=3045158 RepID=A0AAU7EDT5_9FLAO|nr:hypothetical protein [Mariniflexile sp. KMM 9835]MDQ8212145.1 hypothetical protein [Mariniflexile sp. KMM 9835]